MENYKKLYGTTLFIGDTKLKTIYGDFVCFTYQDVIDHKYIMALCYNTHCDDLYIRMHSSCMTSETLRSMDCDCVDQLYGALEKIVEHKAGILFYLLQCGRGASYISKSRGCQLVQHMQDTITTFQAYESLGLKHDYRDYRNVYDIMVMMHIEKKNFHLMTNNPDKIDKINNFGIKIASIVSLQFPSNVYNRKYLLSKQQTGHLLCYKKTNVKLNEIQPSIEPFEPYHLESAERFIHCSTYYLPIRPINRKIIVSEDELGNYKFINKELLPSGDYLIELESDDELNKHVKPYWFKCHVYYDIASHSEYVVLTYGDKNKAPVVRFHCEFIFNRFPLEDISYKNRYTNSILLSIINNSGIIIIANHNTDTSIGRFILSNKEFNVTGIPLKKNLLPLTLLLKHHTKNRPIRALYSDTSRPEMEISFQKSDIKVIEWICINKLDKKGHSILRTRIETSIQYLKDINVDENIFPENSLFYVTGIGSSEAHAKYFIHMAHKNNYQAQFITMNRFKDIKIDFVDHKYLFIISQGLSPHSLLPIKYAINMKKCNNIFILTSVTMNNKDKKKVEILQKFSHKGGNIITFPIEDEYSILMRVIGPLLCYFVIYHLFSNGIINNMAIMEKVHSIESHLPAHEFIDSIVKYDNIIVIVPQDIIDICDNLKYKLLEGAFVRTVIFVGDFDYAHGTYQFCESLVKDEIKPNILLINCVHDELKVLVTNNFNTFAIDTYYKNELCILELEHLFNNIVLKLVINKNIDQIDWPGKKKQNVIYNIT